MARKALPHRLQWPALIVWSCEMRVAVMVFWVAQLTGAFWQLSVGLLAAFWRCAGGFLAAFLEKPSGDGVM